MILYCVCIPSGCSHTFIISPQDLSFYKLETDCSSSPSCSEIRLTRNSQYSISEWYTSMCVGTIAFAPRFISSMVSQNSAYMSLLGLLVFLRIRVTVLLFVSSNTSQTSVGYIRAEQIWPRCRFTNWRMPFALARWQKNVPEAQSRYGSFDGDRRERKKCRTISAVDYRCAHTASVSVKCTHENILWHWIGCNWKLYSGSRI